MLQNSSNVRILSLLEAVLLGQDGVAVVIFSFINLDQRYITLTLFLFSSFFSIALHFFLYILGTTSLLRKIVWSAQLILALMFTLEELCGWVLVCIERLLKNSWQHSITPRNCGATIHRLLRLPRALLRGASRTYPGADDWHHQERLPAVFAHVSALCLEFDWTLRWTWGQSEPESIYRELLCLWHLPHSFFACLFHSLEFLNPPRL